MRLPHLANAVRDRINRVRLRMGTKADFAIISNNCWGSGFYRDLGRPYNTPFVGTMVPPACYLKLLADFPAVLDQPLRFLPKSRYTSWQIRCPVAQIGDSEIHFMHYESQAEAEEKWTRRLERFPRDPAAWRFKFCDHHVGSDAAKAALLLRAFDAMPFPQKVCLLGRTDPQLKSGIVFHECLAEGRVPNGHAAYRPSLRHFSAAAWLNGSAKTS